MFIYCSQDEILSTAYLVAHYLKGIGFTKKVYLIGSNGIGDELKAVGIRHIGVGVSFQYLYLKTNNINHFVKYYVLLIK